MEEIIGRWDCMQRFRERSSFVCFILQYFDSHIGVFERDIFFPAIFVALAMKMQ
jgi:hypothetical protein